MANHHLINITLDERSMVRRTPEIEHERAVAIYDLLEDNRFALPKREGPIISISVLRKTG